MRARFTLSQIMIAIAIIGVSLGLLLQAPRLLMAVLLQLALPIVCLAIPCCAIYLVARLRPKHRLAIEFTILIALVTLSARIWRPRFYTFEERRCLELAARASNASVSTLEARKALDRETAWFTKPASDLRWRGLWLGLTLGPKTRDAAEQAGDGFVYEFATLESIERHEKKVQELIAADSCPEG
jgi:hypothetical protein